MVWTVIFSALCTAGTMIGWVNFNLTKLIFAELEEFHRIEMRMKTARGNSGIKQLCAFLIWFFTSLSNSDPKYMIMSSTI